MKKILASGGGWGETGPSLKEEWLRIYGSPLDESQGSDPVSTGGLEGYDVKMPNGVTIWYGGSNGWEISVETVRDKYFVLGEVLEEREDGQVMVSVRNGDLLLKVGDWWGGEQVLECHAYGKKLDYLGQGMTGGVLLTGMPTACVHKNEDQEFIDWMIKTREKKKSSST